MNAQPEPALPAHTSRGRREGWLSRRDRALLVLTDIAGLSSPQITALTTANITVQDGAATITTSNVTITLHATEENVLCGPCALARWLHALELATRYPDQRVATAVITRGPRLATDSPHACEGITRITPTTHPQPLLPAIDPWGLIPQQAARTTATSR